MPKVIKNKNWKQWVPALLIILSINITVSGQMIEINGIHDDFGFVVIEQGAFEYPTKYKYHILTINKTYLDITYNTLFEQFNSKNYYQTDMVRKYLSLAFKEKQIFLNRHKRGLANIVGDGLRFLFGTMNEDDRIEIRKALSDIKENTISADDFNKMIDHINSETRLLQKFQTDTLRLQNKLTEKIYVDIFLDNVKMYLDHIQDIQMAIQLARLGIVNPKLIDLETITNLTTGQFENIKTSIWTEERFIYFVLSIPIQFEIYKKIKIIPMPDKNNEELNLSEEMDYVTINNLIYQLVDNKIIPIRNSCIKNLLNNNITNCQYVKCSESYVTFVEPNIIITKNLNVTEIKQDCNKLNVNLEGNNIIRINNCKAKINDFEITVKQKVEESIILPAGKDIKNLIKENISLLNLQKHIESIHDKTNYYSIGFSIIIFIVLITIIGLSIKFQKSIYISKFCKTKNVNEDIELSKEGRSDIHETSPTNINIP